MTSDELRVPSPELPAPSPSPAWEHAIECQIEPEHVDPRLADEPQPRAFSVLCDDPTNGRRLDAARPRDAGGLDVRVRGADVRVEPAPRRRHGVRGNRSRVVGILPPELLD